jgi:SAM-dependent methyltransferase
METQSGVKIDWAAQGDAPVSAVCRNCGDSGGKLPLLSAQADLPDQGRLEVSLLDCAACGCCFAADIPPYSYTGAAAGELSIRLYAEAAAGIWPITRAVGQLTAPPGASYLEIGCGFGFGLDFAIRARGWKGRGIDPSPLAVAGRTRLGLPIEARYFGDLPQDEAGPAGTDIIMASEVLEHIAAPPDFVALLRRGLAPDGVLVLTTPDRTYLRPDAPPSMLIPVLSVGAHLVLQTERSLRGLLEQAGFAFVHVEANGSQLVAYASAAPLALDRDTHRLRRQYRDYLAGRAMGMRRQGTLWWGFVGRAYQEAVADEDGEAAARFWRMLRPAFRRRYGFDPDQAGDAPRIWRFQGWRALAGLARLQPALLPRWCCGRLPNLLPWPRNGWRDLARLGRRMPLALPGLLYARALQRVHGGATLPEVAGLMRAAAAAAEDLNNALLPVGAGDLAAVSTRRAALATLAAVAADAGSPDSLEALAEAIAADPEAGARLARRSFVGLVNADALALARALRERWDLGERTLPGPEGGKKIKAEERDLLFCLGVLELQSEGRADAAMGRFQAVRGCTEPGDLWWAALRGECLAAERLGKDAHRAALLASAPLEGMPQDLRQIIAN